MKHQPIYISYPSWEEPGPVYDTKEEAQAWLDDQKKRGRPNEWGYVIEINA